MACSLTPVVLVLVVFEQIGLDAQHVLEVERADVEHGVAGHVAGVCPNDPGERVATAQLDLCLCQRLLRLEIDLVEEQDVGEAYLLGRFVEADLLSDVAGVDNRDDRVQCDAFGEDLVQNEGLDHRSGIGEARGLDNDPVDVAPRAQQVADRADEVRSHGADSRC
jgi:hypothetical protein